MLRYIGRRDENLCEGHGVVRKEVHLQVRRRLWIRVDHTRDIHDETDRELRNVVARCSLSREENDAWVSLLPLFCSHGFEREVPLCDKINM